MDNATELLIRELAEKLGTTSEHLWSVLVKQAPITAATEILTALAVSSTFYYLLKLTKIKTTTPKATETNRFPEQEWKYENAFFAWMVTGIVGVITLLIVCCAFSSSITALLNPEYWALKQLLP